MNKIDLNGRCAVVTGGAQGFGRAIAERFVASGAKVAIWDHDLLFAEKTAREIGPAVSAFKVDVSDLAAVEKTRDETLKALGKIDILVNNAGIAGVNKTVWETDLDEWRKVLRINLDGPFICCKAVVPAMRQAAGGSIVNMASLAATYGMPYGLHYTTSKAAVIGLTRGLARELGRDNIRVNALAPSAVLTEGTREFFAEKADKALDTIKANQAIARNLAPSDLLGVVHWLVSDSSQLVTGQTIAVDGGTVMH